MQPASRQGLREPCRNPGYFVTLACCVRQVQQIGHVERALADVQVNSSIPLFDRKGPSLRPDLPFGRAPRAAAVKDAGALAAAPAEPARSVLDRASTVLD